MTVVTGIAVFFFCFVSSIREIASTKVFKVSETVILEFDSYFPEYYELWEKYPRCIPSFVAVLCRQGPTIQSQFKTQSESI
jgi:hypothetical protein